MGFVEWLGNIWLRKVGIEITGLVSAGRNLFELAATLGSLLAEFSGTDVLSSASYYRFLNTLVGLVSYCLWIKYIGWIAFHFFGCYFKPGFALLHSPLV